MLYSVWQAPDRDSVDAVDFHNAAELAPQLQALVKMDGGRGTNDDDVQRVTGVTLTRARRWHKIYERMGLLYQDQIGNTALTGLGKYIASLNDTLHQNNRRVLASTVIPVLARYQLKNPEDETAQAHYPDDADIHPYWAIWKAISLLDHRLHWDELNRELMHVLRHDELAEAIERIREARLAPGYNPLTAGSEGSPLRARSYDQTDAPDGRDADGQIRDQKMTPWFRRAAFGKLLLLSPAETAVRDGYWRTAPDMRDLIDEAVRARPQFELFTSTDAWFNYYGSLRGDAPIAPASSDPTEQVELLRILLSHHNAVAYGPPGTGKTTAALHLSDDWERTNGPGTVFRTTFHPNFTYEDFVQGYRPRDSGGFELRNGIFLEASIKAATLGDAAKILLLIDEINRGDTARIFGELLTYIEPDKRGIAFSLALDPLRTTSVPENLYILGTMNTADRSVSLLDLAFRRRFAFVPFPPSIDAFNDPRFMSMISGVHLPTLLQRLNSRLLQSGIDPERQIGQGVLLIRSNVSDPLASLKDRFRFELVPAIAEYCYPNKNRVHSILGDLVDHFGQPAELDDQAFISAVQGIT